MDVGGLITLTEKKEAEWKENDFASYQYAKSKGLYDEDNNELLSYDVLPDFLKNTIPNPGEPDIILCPSGGEQGQVGEDGW